MKKAFLLISLHFVCIALQAQILNIEKSRLDNDTTGWLGSFEVQIDLVKQEQHTLDLGSNLHALRLTPKNAYMVIADIEIVRSEKEDLISNGYLHMRMTMNFKRKLSEELFGQIQYNDVLGMQHRYLGGAGARLTLLDRKKIAMAFSAGVMYEVENWKSEEEISEINNTLWKSTSYLSLRWKVSENVDFNMINYYQARFTDFFAPRVSSDINLRFKINKRFSFGSKFSVIYDAAPVVPISNLIYSLKNGLSYNF
ncbi:DUF481 domain-containing protein [Rapidithrix thailandica]|uniref:DUF481 domain-containing protein n=1 Tax=Rapidithrix thailandica TaxID=413964 RepID=A0AAW9S320_9BACT